VPKPVTNPKAAPNDGVQEKGDADAAAQGNWDKQPPGKSPGLGDTSGHVVLLLVLLKALLGEALTHSQGKLLVWGIAAQACKNIGISKSRTSLNGLVYLSNLVKKGSPGDMGHVGYTFSSSEAAVL
ncbi:hypothetical protein EK904_001051, partial [Melospiza melodia maxima]